MRRLSQFTRWTPAFFALIVGLAAFPAIAEPPFTVLFWFEGGPVGAAVPLGGLTLGADGTLFGTTLLGGAGTKCGSGGCGSVFSVRTDTPWFTVLHSFLAGPGDGSYPTGGVIFDANGNLYGTASAGGGNTLSDTACSSGCGAIYTAKADGTGYRILHAFSLSPTDGAAPADSLILDSNGNLYGTTELGGSEGGGTVFAVKTDGTGFRLLHSFVGDDGASPLGGLVLDESGNLYGTTSSGGPSAICEGGKCGTVFTVSTDGTSFSVLHSFSLEPDDGYAPKSGLILDGSGYLFGTTESGGANGCQLDPRVQDLGCGTVFKIRSDGTGFTVLHSFSYSSNDGTFPEAGLTLDAYGNLYGTTFNGGSNEDVGCFGPFTAGCGTVFTIKTDGTGFALLHSFSPAEGAFPSAGLILDANANLYGTTSAGGAFSNCGDGCGTIFKLILSPRTGGVITPLTGPARPGVVTGRSE